MLNSSRDVPERSDGQIKARDHSWLRIGVVFAVFYVLALIVTVPASMLVAAGQNALRESGIGLTPAMVEGTVWRGRITSAEGLNGINGLTWRWQPQSLLTGRLGAAIAVGRGDALAGQIAVAVGGALALNHVRIDGRLSDLASSLNGVPLLSDAQVQGIVDGAILDQDGCHQLTRGQLLLEKWSGFAATSLEQLQGIQVTLSCMDKSLQGNIAIGREDAGFAGTFSVSPDYQYQLRLSAQPRTAEMQELFENLGFRRQGGMLVVTRAGQLQM